MPKLFKRPKPVFIFTRDGKPNKMKFVRGTKIKSFDKFNTWKNYTRERYPWLKATDNFDWYLHKKSMKQAPYLTKDGDEHGYGPASKNFRRKDYSMNSSNLNEFEYADRLKLHRSFKRDKKKRIQYNHNLAKKRRAQLRAWRASGAKGRKPSYPTKL